VAIQFTNSMSGKVQKFTPIEAGVVRMYHCGPTVYGYAHIGNYRAFLLGDLLRRLFEFHGVEVQQVMNITDVGHMTVDEADAGEDKMAKAAKKEGKGPLEIARFYEEAFLKDVDALGIQRAHHYPRASEHVPEMIDLVEKLIENGNAYVSGDTVLFDITTFSGYGELSRKRIEDLQVGAGGRISEEMLAGKRNPGDFRLWKVDPSHVLKWDSPWGPGYPGWHLECSVMARKYLGDTIDIHSGGEDNIFPHHESERAQIEPITKKPFVNYWIHTRHLMSEGTKMSKSLGNFYTVRNLIDEGYEPVAIRYLLISANYRTQMNFTRDGVKVAWENVNRIRSFVRRMGEVSSSGDSDTGLQEVTDGFLAKYTDAVDDDLNISQALGHLFDYMKEVNKREPAGQEARHAIAAIQKADILLGILKQESAGGGGDDARIDALVQERIDARTAKNFARADEIRDELTAEGIVIEDTKDGVRWFRQ
jgi:cysteinyl-tRNA synthetase